MRYSVWEAAKELYWLILDTIDDLRLGEKLDLPGRLRAYWQIVSGQVDPDAPLELMPSDKAIQEAEPEMQPALKAWREKALEGGRQV